MGRWIQQRMSNLKMLKPSGTWGVCWILHGIGYMFELDIQICKSDIVEQVIEWFRWILVISGQTVLMCCVQMWFVSGWRWYLMCCFNLFGCGPYCINQSPPVAWLIFFLAEGMTVATCSKWTHSTYYCTMWFLGQWWCLIKDINWMTFLLDTCKMVSFQNCLMAKSWNFIIESSRKARCKVLVVAR